MSNNSSVTSTVLLGVLLAGFSQNAVAQNAHAGTLSAQERVLFQFEAGVGGAINPAYEGASQYEFSALPKFSLKYLRLGDNFEIGGSKKSQGFSVSPSFNIVNERTSADFAALTSLPDVDLSIEAGGQVSFEYEMFRAFTSVRYGVVGHNGIVGEAGVDFTFSPIDNLSLTVGPRVSAANDAYMDTYFGVSSAAALSSGLPQYNVSGGIKSVGVEANARYDFEQDWAMTGKVSWNRLVGAAADSPITTGGSADQFRAEFGLLKSFTITE